ncbi:hypothetical protein SmJEL517_g05052 [Synchytrium microbalum]|uniref:sn-1-specific diacylglycerol lipase n=1 Tax=Synchytrium microbalum TaxID=1806994 RepID=A0A507BX23_9FUNG|nr:uncharacterized protein SmJEL517_g05052 [Synchytrium microbalum]TPX31641.1 hypothetical protein SmJEL517_g05052 [Synchytrium microbalum]
MTETMDVDDPEPQVATEVVRPVLSARRPPEDEITPPDQSNHVISNIVMGVSTLVNVASTATTIGFEIAKWSTRFGLMASRTVVNGIGEITGLTPISTIVSGSLDVAEFFAIAGITTGQTVTSVSLRAASDSLSTIDTLFGSGETGKAVAEFARLVKREMGRDDGMGTPINDLNIFEILKSLTTWVSLQYLTRQVWEETAISGCKQIFASPIIEELMDEDEEYQDAADTHDNANANGNSDRNLPNNDDVVLVASEGDVSQGIVGDIKDAGSEPKSSWTIPTENNSFNLQLLLKDIKRASRYSIGTYGTTIVNFLVDGVLPVPSIPWESWLRNEQTTQSWLRNEQISNQIHRNHDTLATLADVPVASIISSSYDNRHAVNSGRYHPTFYVIVDHPHKQVVLALRGTLSIHDLMVDLTCDFETVKLPAGQEARVHGGMWKAAKALSQPRTRVYESIKKALQELPGYSLLITGHSLGASLGALLTMQWGDANTGTIHELSGLPVGRTIQCFAFACPQVVDKATSKLLQSIILSVVIDDDIIPRLSLGSVRDLKNVVIWMHNNSDLTVGLTRRAIAIATSSHPEIQPSESQIDAGLRYEIENACLNNEKLYPAGRVLWLMTGRIYEVVDLEAVFGCLVFSSGSAGKHLPHVYERAISSL